MAGPAWKEGHDQMKEQTSDSDVANDMIMKMLSDPCEDLPFNTGIGDISAFLSRDMDELLGSGPGDHKASLGVEKDDGKEHGTQTNQSGHSEPPTGPANTAATAGDIQVQKARGRRATIEGGGSDMKRVRSMSPNFWGKGKPSMSVLRGFYPYHVRGVVEPKDFDKEEYSGVVTVDFKARFNSMNAVGTSVARSFQISGAPRGKTRIIPGRVIGQKSLTGRLTGMKYRIVYLNGVEETVNETYLKSYVTVFNNASTSTETNLKPIIVRMT